MSAAFDSVDATPDTVSPDAVSPDTVQPDTADEAPRRTYVLR